MFCRNHTHARSKQLFYISRLNSRCRNTRKACSFTQSRERGLTGDCVERVVSTAWTWHHSDKGLPSIQLIYMFTGLMICMKLFWTVILLLGLTIVLWAEDFWYFCGVAENELCFSLCGTEKGRIMSGLSTTFRFRRQYCNHHWICQASCLTKN